ncbi:MAG: hypothetical protein HOI66_22555 [Verrucomicrobia bacterium]|jgi:hypothetical protein|nr:hypothetical protein [Verrucomicrobiota bacterium]
MVRNFSLKNQVFLNQKKNRGSLQIDLAVAMAILVLALIPITTSIRQERQLCRALYHRAVAMSIVDGEAEVLRAGNWRDYAIGSHEYDVSAKAASTLPAGKFTLSRSETHIQLLWKPSNRNYGGSVLREFSIPQSP